MRNSRGFRAAAIGALAFVIVALGPQRGEAGNENHPYGVLPYGFNYPTDAHIWGALGIVYHWDMRFTHNWGPNGPGYYSCGPGCRGPYGYSPCCGLTPLHYNAVTPANVARPYPVQPGLSYYNSTPVAYQPVPGWDVPEYPPGVAPHPFGYTTMNGFKPYTKHTTTPGGIWYAGKEMEMNFWAKGAVFPSQRPRATGP